VDPRGVKKFAVAGDKTAFCEISINLIWVTASLVPIIRLIHDLSRSGDGTCFYVEMEGKNGICPLRRVSITGCRSDLPVAKGWQCRWVILTNIGYSS
jgi:hypothetical protein